ncbi:MAG: glycosyltransferase [Desulfobacterales bacterium]|nr:glycosyltransferase [Desulfobacterales bacterium]
MRLSLFFTRGMSLRLWEKHGMLPREIAPYQRLASSGMEVDFITYGKSGEEIYAKRLNPVKILHNPWRTPHDLYSLLICWTHRKELKKTDIVKTNQINGWWAAGLAKLIFRKPLVVRCGYLLSMNQEPKWKGYSPGRVRFMSLLEKAAFKYADAAIVTTPLIKEEAVRRHGVNGDKIFVIPNTVDTRLFRPAPHPPKIPGRIGYVGRLTREKSVDLLIRAAAGLEGVSLLIIGDGPQREPLENLAAGLRVKTRFCGVTPNDKLPELLRACEGFALPSELEGNPKALLEAMACGLPVIGANVPGVRELINHKRTGYLCEHSEDGIRRAIAALMKDPALRKETGENARQFIVDNYSLESAVSREFQLLQTVKKHAKRGRRDARSRKPPLNPLNRVMNPGVPMKRNGSSPPVVSVLMSAYNERRWIGEAIESILAQTWGDFELIIADDGSNDGTSRIIEGYKAVDRRIRVITHPEPMGLANTLNEMIGVARGFYFARMDGDDIAREDRFEKQIRYLKKHPEVGMVGSFCREMDADGRIVGTWRRPTTDFALQKALYKYNPFIHSSVILRREVFDKVGLYNPACRYAQDIELWLRVSREFKLGNIGEPLVDLRVDWDKLNRKNKASRKTYFRIMAHHVRTSPSPRGRHYAYLLYHLALYLTPGPIMMLLKKLQRIIRRGSPWTRSDA